MINASETTVRSTTAAIARAALFDDKVTAGDAPRIAAWAEALEPHGLETRFLLDAVTRHYSDPNLDRTIRVADLIHHGRELRRQAAEVEKGHDPHGPAVLPAGAGWSGLPINATGKAVDAAYDVNDAITRPCPRCHAEANDYCITSRDQKQRIPCLPRLTGKPPRFAQTA